MSIGRESVIRSYFQFGPDVDNAICMIDDCGVSIEGKNIINLEKHVERWHSDTYEEFIKVKSEQTIEESSIKKPGTSKRSAVWDHFVMLSETQGQCCHCDNVIRYTKNSMSNLFRHLGRKHKSVLEDAKKQSAEKIPPEKVDLEKLINLVRSRRSLWDENSVGFDDQDLSEYLWVEVAEQLQTTPYGSISQWENLKNSYHKQLQETSAYGDDNIKSEFIYFDSLKFLTDNVYDDSTDAVETEDDKTTLMNTLPRYDTRPKKRQLRSFKSPPIPNKRERIASKTENTRQDIDEDVSFFNSLLPFVRKLSYSKKLLIRNDFNNAILKYINIREKEEGVDVETVSQLIAAQPEMYDNSEMYPTCSIPM